MASISERENGEIEAANASGNTPVVFIHGLWVLPSSWDNWADLFREAGYPPLTPDWPDDPETVEEARANPDILAGKTLGEIADHTTEVIDALEKKPAVMGHSTGGLLAQMLGGPRTLRRHGRDRSGPVSRGPPAARLDAEGDGADLDQSPQSRPRGNPHLRPVQIRLDERNRVR
jgi:hypothetical protein